MLVRRQAHGVMPASLLIPVSCPKTFGCKCLVRERSNDVLNCVYVSEFLSIPLRFVEFLKQSRSWRETTQTVQNIHISFSNIEIIYGTSNDETWSPGCYLQLQEQNFVKFVDHCLGLLALRLYCPSGSDFFCQSWSAFGCAHTSMALIETVPARRKYIHNFTGTLKTCLAELTVLLFPYFLSLVFFRNSLFF